MTDAPSDPDVVAKIVAFATHLSEPERDDASARAAARERGWLDENNAPTATGRELARAIDEQQATRSAIRNI